MHLGLLCTPIILTHFFHEFIICSLSQCANCICACCCFTCTAAQLNRINKGADEAGFFKDTTIPALPILEMDVFEPALYVLIVVAESRLLSAC